MSMYDNFRAPQFVDFAGINSGSDITTDTSSFFDRDTDMDSTPAVGNKLRDSSATSSNGTFSDNDKTLTPARFCSSFTSTCGGASTGDANLKRTLSPFKSGFNVTQSPSVKCFKSTISNSPIGINADDSMCDEVFNVPSHRMSTPMVPNGDTRTKKVRCGSPLQKSCRFTEGNVSEVSNSSSGKTPKPTSTEMPPNGTIVSRKSRCSGVTSKYNRRSRSACSTKSLITDEEILNDAIQTLSISSSLKKTPSGVASEVDQFSSPTLVPGPPAVNKISKKPQEGVAPKRKLSPPPKNTRDYGQQPSKYISMAEHIAKIQKQTPKRFRTMPSNAASRKGVQSKVARNLSTQPKSTAVSSSVPLVAQNNGSSGLKGVRVAQWHQPKVEPFVLTQYKKKELPKTVFNFEQKECVILRDRRTPYKRVRQTTQVQPFSFDKRDQEILQRKMYRRLGVETQNHCCQTKGRRRSKSQGDENSSNTVKDPLVHHARVPTVLQKPPFVPQMKSHKVTKPVDICLNTEKRAKEREEFDEYRKKKEMESLVLLEKLREERRLQEEKEMLKLRKGLVHKARAVPVLQPFKVHSSDAPLTDPCTPSFLHRSKQIHDPKSTDDPMEI